MTWKRVFRFMRLAWAQKSRGSPVPGSSPNRSTDACRLGALVISQLLGFWRRHCYELRPWSAFQHWRLTRHLSQNEGCALAMMRSSYEVRVELPGGSKSLLVRASSRSEACRMAAEAHPGRAFVVIGRIDAIPALP